MWFAWTQVVLSTGASINYFWMGDWKHGLYWGCAAGINYAVLAMRG